jgi:OOP family OmpA-OmpF porin
MSRFGWILETGSVAIVATVVAGVVCFAPIAEDVSRRAADHLKATGRGWAAVAIDGRDVTLTGMAPEPNDRQLAVDAADRVFGVRVVTDHTTVLPLASPWAWGVERRDTGSKLFGAVSSAAARSEMQARAAAALGGSAIADETTFARGAPADWPARRDLALALAADLASGEVAWSGDTLTVTGTPRDFAAWEAMTRRLGIAPAGVKVVSADLATPAPPRWSVSATRSGGRLVLDGFLPDAAARARVVAAATAAGLTVEDRTRIAPGAASGTDAALDFGMKALADLSEGGMKIDPTGFTLAGRPKSWQVWRNLEAALKLGVPGGLPLVADALVPVAPPSYRFDLSAASGLVTASGFVPDLAARDRLLAALRANFGAVKAELDVAPGAPAGFVDAILAAIPTLARFTGFEFRLEGGAAKVSGSAPTVALGRRILAKLAGLLPAGFALAEGSSVAALPPPPQVDAATCQADLAAVQSGGKILFDSGEATLRDEGLRILDALVATSLKCLEARITIEGHTDGQGDETSNQRLSEERARAVLDYLTAGGIAVDRLTAVGFGQTRPIADDATEEGRQANRRIEFRVE